MKKLFLLFLLGCCLSISCRKENPVQDPSGPIPTTVIERLKALGFNINDIVRVDSGYLVEKDIFLHDRDLEKFAVGLTLRIAETEQYSTIQLVSGLPRTIRVRVVGLPVVYIQAAKEMIANYNALGLQLKFEYVAPTLPADITIQKAPCSTATPTSGFPSGGNPFPNIFIPCTFDASLSCYVRKVLEHEIAHCIGLRHADWMNRAYSCGGAASNEGAGPMGAIHIPGTPTSPDAGSLFLACLPKDCNSFNDNDVTALLFIYGQKPQIPIAGSPVAISRHPDDISVFAMGKEDKLYFRYWSAAAPWTTPWQDLGTGPTADLAAIARNAGSIDVFSRTINNTLIHKSWSTTGGWSAWTDLGAITTGPAVTSRGSDHLQVFSGGTGNKLMARTWRSATGWAAWEDLGGNITSTPSAVSRDTNNTAVFARGSAGNLVLRQWNNSSGWAAWQDLGGSFSGVPAADARSAQNIDVFVRNGSSLLSIQWSAASGWSAWTNRGGAILSDPAVTSRDANNIQVFASSSTKNLVSISWSNTGGWGTWANHSGRLSAKPAVTSRAPQNIDVFANCAAALKTISWVSPTGWSAWFQPD